MSEYIRFRLLNMIEVLNECNITRLICAISVMFVFSFSLNVFISPVTAQTSDDQSISKHRETLDIEASAPVVVTAPTLFKDVASTFVLPITVPEITADGVFSFQFNITYDPTVIDPSGPNFGCSTAGTIAGAAGLSPTCNVLPDGTLRVSVSGVSAMVGSGTILNLTFTTDAVTGGAGDISPLTFTSVFFFNAAGQVANSPVSGQVTLVSPTAAGATVSGRVWNRDGRPVPRARVSLTDSSGFSREGTSNPFGYYRLQNVPTGAVYTIGTTSKRFIFTSRSISVADNVFSFDFIAEP